MSRLVGDSATDPLAGPLPSRRRHRRREHLSERIPVAVGRMAARFAHAVSRRSTAWSRPASSDVYHQVQLAESKSQPKRFGSGDQELRRRASPGRGVDAVTTSPPKRQADASADHHVLPEMTDVPIAISASTNRHTTNLRRAGDDRSHALPGAGQRRFDLMTRKLKGLPSSGGHASGGRHTGSMVLDLGLLIIGVAIYAVGILYFANAAKGLSQIRKRGRSGLLLLVPAVGLGVALFGALRLSDAQHWGFWALLAYLALLGLVFLLLRRLIRRKVTGSG